MNAMSDPTRQVECTIPVLPVQDLGRSIQFYTEVLEFQVDWGGHEGASVCSVSRDGCCIMLMQSEQVDSPRWVWIGLEDASLFSSYQAKGVEVLQPPRNCSWAYEMKFADLDGTVLWCGTEPRQDMPFEDPVSV